RPGDLVTGRELLVAGQYVLAPALVPGWLETWFAGFPGRHRHRALAVGVRDLARADVLPDAAFQFLASAPQKTLAVAKALFLGVQSAVDENRHGLSGSTSAGLVHAHVPIHQPADLAFRITALDHTLDELSMA